MNISVDRIATEKQVFPNLFPRSLSHRGANDTGVIKMIERFKPMNDRKCTVDGCDNRGEIKHGFCNKHYRRWRRHGNPLGGGPEQDRTKWTSATTNDVDRQCTIEGCDRIVKAQGLCAAHYCRWQKYGDPLMGGPMRKPAKDQIARQCSVAGCEKKAVTRGYCPGHYHRFIMGKEINTPLIRQNIGKPQFELNGYVVFTDKKHPMAIGKAGRVAMHRAIMSEKLGRPLRKGELVHHINGIRDDNRPENLELFYKGHPPGQRPEELVEWAYKILEMYEDEVNAKSPKLKLISK